MTQHKHVTGLESQIGVANRPFGRHGEQPLSSETFAADGPVLVYPNVRELVIVQAGAAHLCVVEGKTEWLYQMQTHTGIGAQPNDVAGIGGNLGLVENQVDARVRRLSRPQWAKPAAGGRGKS